MEVCIDCGEPIEGLTWSTQNGGWDCVSICPGCGIVEPDTVEIDDEEYDITL